MTAFHDADTAYGAVVGLARQAQINEEKIKDAGMIYWSVRCLHKPAQEDPQKVPAFAAAIDAIAGKIMEALGATPDGGDLATAIGGLPAELTGAFSIGIDFDTAVIAAYGEQAGGE